MKLSNFLLIILLMTGLSFAGCGGGGDSEDGDTDNTIDGDDEQTDGDIEVEADEPDGDIDGDIDEDTEVIDGDDETDIVDHEVWEGSKCSEDENHYNDKDVEYRTSATTLRYCKTDSDINGAQIDFIKKSTGYILKNDVHVVISEGDDDIEMAGWKAVGPPVKFTATTIEEDDVVQLKYDASFRIPYYDEELPEYAEDFYIYVAFKVDEDNEIIPETWDGKPELIAKSYQSIKVTRWPGLVNFSYNRFGTYQVVVPDTEPETDTRDFTFKAIAGISMGCGGAAINGFLNPEKFDLLGPMGGLMDLRYLAANMSTTYLAGFCPMETILADTSESAIDAFVTNEYGHCGAQEFSEEYPEGNPDGYPQNTSKHWSTPIYKWYMKAPRELYKMDEHAQGYNHWYYDFDGGGFDRNSYVHLFRDLSYSFGNASNYNPESPYFAAGLTGDPEDENTRLGYYMKYIYKPDGSFRDEKKSCRNLANWMKDNPLYGFYDRKYNPDGSYPVIYFCDGNNSSDEFESGDYQPHFQFEDTGADGLYNYQEPGYNASTNPDPNGDDYNADSNPEGTEGNGEWDPYEAEPARSLRFDLALAVDYNKNGIRDFGEPVIGQFFEPYADCGTDGLCNVDEPGYDAESNPDPNGDDYSPYTNPLGTEGNFLYEEGEVYEDLGLDGVACPVKGACEFDYGEGNSKFDYNPNLKNMLEFDPYLNVMKMSDEQLLSLNIWMDGGIRDLFNFVIMGDNLYAALADRLNPLGVNTGTYQDFTAITTSLLDRPANFDYFKVNYPMLGHASMMRYGSYDASDELVLGGNGRHVDEGQMLKRVITFYAYADSVFPNGDYEVKSMDVGGSTETRGFYSEALGRDDKFVIALPPGYYDYNQNGPDNGPDTCTKRYPIIYFGHGYGMDPEGMAATTLILGTYMANGQIQKIISVFTNGRCYDQSQCNEDCESICNGAVYFCNQECQKNNCEDAEDFSACRDQCETDCDTQATTCINNCKGSEGRDCANVITECDKGNFYVDHVANKELPLNGTTGPKIGTGLMDLMDFVDENYCTKEPLEGVEIDAKSRLPIY